MQPFGDTSAVGTSLWDPSCGDKLSGTEVGTSAWGPGFGDAQQGRQWGHPSGDMLGGFQCVRPFGHPLGTRIPWGMCSRAGSGCTPWGTHWQWVNPLGDKLAVSAPPRGHVAGLAVGAPPGDARHPTGCPLLPIAAHKEPRVPVPRQHPLTAAEAFNVFQRLQLMKFVMPQPR